MTLIYFGAAIPDRWIVSVLQWVLGGREGFHPYDRFDGYSPHASLPLAEILDPHKGAVRLAVFDPWLRRSRLPGASRPLATLCLVPCTPGAC